MAFDGQKQWFGRLKLGNRGVDVQVDVGFGDAPVPDPSRCHLTPFLDDDEPARVVAYDLYTVLAEKIETVITRFPVIAHRLKDVLDVVVIDRHLDLDCRILRLALDATAERRGSSLDERVLDSMVEEMTGRVWDRDGATMRREKAVQAWLELRVAVEQFAAIVRPILETDSD